MTSLIIDIKIYVRVLYSSIVSIYCQGYSSKILYTNEKMRIHTISGMISNVKFILNTHRIITPFCNTLGYNA